MNNRIIRKLLSIKVIYKIYEITVQRYKIRNKRKLIAKYSNVIISKVTDALNTVDLNWFFDFGTLLGIIRDGQVLPHDLDIDIGVIGTFIDFSAIDNAFECNGIKPHSTNLVDSTVVSKGYTYKKIKIDIHFYQSTEESSYCYIFVRKYKDKLLAEKAAMKMLYPLIKSTIKYNVYNISVNIPENYIELLVSKYGANWNIPDSSWNSSQSPTAILTEEKAITIYHDQS